jgi:hypothetical protein
MKRFKFELGRVSFLLMLLLVVVSVCLFVLHNTPVKAWSAPVVTSQCAPDENNFSFKVTLAAEINYDMEWSFDPGFATATSVTLNLGDNTVTVPRDGHISGDPWYIRFTAPDHATGSANADGTLCNPPTASPTATPTSTPTPTPQVESATTPAPTTSTECVATKPGTPVILSVVQKGSDATLTWSATANTTYYSIVYGNIPGKFNYGAPNVGNVTTYTIHALQLGTMYHYGVIAVNDCMPGDIGTYSGGTGGQVLAASTMAGTGSFDETFFQAIMSIGATLSAFGLKGLKKGKKASTK